MASELKKKKVPPPLPPRRQNEPLFALIGPSRTSIAEKQKLATALRIATEAVEKRKKLKETQAAASEKTKQREAQQALMKKTKAKKTTSKTKEEQTKTKQEQKLSALEFLHKTLTPKINALAYMKTRMEQESRRLDEVFKNNKSLGRRPRIRALLHPVSSIRDVQRQAMIIDKASLAGARLIKNKETKAILKNAAMWAVAYEKFYNRHAQDFKVLQSAAKTMEEAGNEERVKAMKIVMPSRAYDMQSYFDIMVLDKGAREAKYK